MKIIFSCVNFLLIVLNAEGRVESIIAVSDSVTYTIFKELLAFEATFPARLAVLGLTRRS